MLVSHHPPVGAFYLSNKKAGVHLSGHYGQKTKFTGTAIQVEQTGCLFLYVEKYNEEYAISLPELYLRGIVTGAPFVELTGETLIVCSSHKIASKIRFIPKPWFSGEYNLLEGIIYDDYDKDIKFEIWGNWSKQTYIEAKGNDPDESHLANIESGIVDKGESSNLLFDAEANEMVHPKLFKEQDQLESRQVWNEVTTALAKADYELASSKKNEIEDAQRDLRKERAANGIVWLPMTFNYEERFFLAESDEASLADIQDANVSTESLIRLKNMEISSPSLSNTNSASASSSEASGTLEKYAAEKMKFTGRWVSFEFLDFFEKAVSK